MATRRMIAAANKPNEYDTHTDGWPHLDQHGTCICSCRHCMGPGGCICINCSGHNHSGCLNAHNCEEQGCKRS